MRKSTLAVVSAAILGSVTLAACDLMGGGGDEKKDGAATEEGGSESGEGASDGAGAGGKPADDGAGGGSESGGDEAASGGSESGGGAKPDEEGGSSGGSSGGSGGGSSGGSSGGSGGQPSEQEVVNHYTQQLDGYLDAYVEEYAADSRSAGIRDVVVPLQAGREHVWNINLEGGRNYGIFGACDNDCSDVDLIVEGPNGQELGRDVLLDDYPIVGFTAPSSGRYTVRIQLVTCEVEPCFVAGRVVTQ
jgi:predicted small secreted protein